LLLSACAPTPQGNVAAYIVGQWLGNNKPSPASSPTPLLGALTGEVLVAGKAAANVTVLVAEADGTPHSSLSDSNGRYRIEGIPPGQYRPAAIAPGLEEQALSGLFGIPWLVTIESGETTTAPALQLLPHLPATLPAPLAASIHLSRTAVYTTATNFPPNSQADVQAFQFVYAGATVDSLRLYLPRHLDAGARLPLLFMIYPSPVDRWLAVSTGYAAQGYALVAISPSAARGLDIDAHALDALIAFKLAVNGALTEQIAPCGSIALGGSFSSAILHRFLRELAAEPQMTSPTAAQIVGWVTVGGTANAFSGGADFYAGKLAIPPEYQYLIPALGPANIYPLQFLRYSPVYTAAELPDTLVIHTEADQIIPISQAYELEAALKAAHVPVQVFYYKDVSHYLQIGDDITEAGIEMFGRVLDFIQQHNQAQGCTT
jgi:acetyl esterase/lipase